MILTNQKLIYSKQWSYNVYIKNKFLAYFKL